MVYVKSGKYKGLPRSGGRKATGKPIGRPESEIDWELVDRLLISGCTGTEIAPHFNIHPNTLYLKCEQNFNMNFSEYSAQKKSKGDSLLKTKQFEKAVKGDNVMLVWLGKNRLGQRDGEDKNKESPQHEELKKLLTELSNANKQQADSIFPRSDETPEHMGGCSPVREDLQLDSETY